MIYPMDDIARTFVECRGRYFYEYFFHRGISLEWLNRMQIGYYPDHEVLDQPISRRKVLEEIGFFLPIDVKRMYQNMFTLPVIVRGHVVSFIFRRNPLIRSSPVSSAGDTLRERGRYLVLENREKLSVYPYAIVTRPYPVTTDSDNDEVTVVEGSIDAIKCGQAGFPNPIARVSDTIESLMEKLDRNPEIVGRLKPPKLVRLFFDWDTTGQRTIFQLCTKLMGYNPYSFEFRIHVPCQAPPESKDPGDMPNDLLQMTRDSETYTPKGYVERIIDFSMDLDDPWQRHAVRQYERRLTQQNKR